MFTRVVAITVVVIMSITAAVPAAADPAHAPERASRAVPLAGVDLASPAGIAEAERRIAAAARHLCRSFEDTRRVSDRETYVACVRDTGQAALQQLEARLPTAVAATGEALRR